MVIVNILQSVGFLILYTFLTIALPSLFFNKKLCKHSISEKFMIYLVTGNFYIMNLVFILQLLHISNIYTLIIFTLLPFFIYIFVRKRTHVKFFIIRQLDYINRVIKGYAGVKTVFGKITADIKVFIKKYTLISGKFIKQRKTELIIFTVIFSAICIIYGGNSIFNYGYTYSDLPVHNYWINEMSTNNIFVDGVYPYGYHAVIYYMHTVFGIDTYVLLRLFALTEVLYIFLVIFAFIKCICQTRYVVYAGIFTFAVCNVYNSYCLQRYTSVLPQEYGMMFILPSIYFIFNIFKHQRLSIKTGEKEYKKRVKVDCLFAAISFSLTIAVHFYDTMIAAFFVLAIVVGFFTKVFNRKYFFKLFGTGMLALLIGVLPMGIAVAQGKPMQGSIGWGLSVISGNKTENAAQQMHEENKNTGPDIESSYQEYVFDSAGNLVYLDNIDEEGNRTSVDVDGVKPDKITQGKEKGIAEKIIDLAKRIWIQFFEVSELGLFVKHSNILVYAVIVSCIFMFLYGAAVLLVRKNEYGSICISVSIFIVFLMVLFVSESVGLPPLMDMNRSRIYLAYMLTILFSMLLDTVCIILSAIVRKLKAVNAVSLSISLLTAAIAIGAFGIRNVIYLDRSASYQTNGAIYALTNIKEQRPEKMWTIVSANDELRMIDQSGYHVETISFLRRLKAAPEGYKWSIPTKYIYLFVEKRPLNYGVTYDGSGQMISRKGAKEMLPTESGITPYTGKNRWIIMSKLYFWAEKYRQKFPEDMSVYYEDDEFICYQLVQDINNLHNLMIDYEYNR